MSKGYIYKNDHKTKIEHKAEAMSNIKKIVSEYGLIQQKKSKLSRSKRLNVIALYKYLLEKSIIKEKL